MFFPQGNFTWLSFFEIGNKFLFNTVKLVIKFYIFQCKVLLSDICIGNVKLLKTVKLKCLKIISKSNSSRG